MNPVRTATKGYVLPLSLMMVATLMILVTSIINRVAVTRYVTRNEQMLAQAKLLALSGVQIACAQLQEAKEQSALQGKEKKMQKVAEPQLGGINGFEQVSFWHEYKTTQSVDGVDGNIAWYIVPEAGKIPINALFDFKKKNFVQDAKTDGRKVMTAVGQLLQPYLKSINFVEVVEKFLTTQKEPIDDITKFREIPELQPFTSVFFPQQRMEKEKNVPTFADLFTVTMTQREINPLYMSLSLQTVLAIPVPSNGSIKSTRKQLADLLLDGKTTKVFEEKNEEFLYKKQLKDIRAEIQPLFSTKFEVTYFSVVSYGKLDALTQGVYAIIERTLNKDKQAEYVIRKIYWI